jgi:hypothetical protein
VPQVKIDIENVNNVYSTEVECGTAFAARRNPHPLRRPTLAQAVYAALESYVSLAKMVGAEETTVDQLLTDIMAAHAEAQPVAEEKIAKMEEPPKPKPTRTKKAAA